VSGKSQPEIQDFGHSSMLRLGLQYEQVIQDLNAKQVVSKPTLSQRWPIFSSKWN
jgi:hypothetical protein